MIIGISGKIGSGKDTFAAILKELQPERQWQVKKFAGKLKQAATLLTGVPLEKWEDPEFKKQNMSSEWEIWSRPELLDGGGINSTIKQMTYREFLQKLGTDVMRDGLHTNVWVNALFADYKLEYNAPVIGPDWMREEHHDYPNWTITDVRFPNEAQAVRDRGGVLIRLHRNEDTGDHPSETALDDWPDWDAEIYNNASIEAFRKAIEEISARW